jgi:hypothetical protein
LMQIDRVLSAIHMWFSPVDWMKLIDCCIFRAFHQENIEITEHNKYLCKLAF